jgi:hypothetical protein
MGAVTTSIGGGPSTAADQTISMNSITSLVSNVVLSTTSTYVSGGFDSIGNSYITRPVAVIDVSVPVGRNGSSTSSITLRPFFKTSQNGVPGKDSTVSVDMNSLSPGQDIILSTESTYAYPAFANSSTVYFGFEGVSGSGIIEYGRGGSANAIYYQVLTSPNTTSTLDELGGSDKLEGSITQASIPSAPGSFSFSSPPTDKTIYLQWNPPADDGMQSPAAYSASNIKGYRINYRNDPEENWKVLVANTGSNATTATVGGLSPSTYYELQFAALNAVTDAHNTNYSSITAHVGARGPAQSFTTAVSTNDVGIWTGTELKKSIIKIWDGAAWIQYPNVRAKVWNGTAFQNLVLDS